MPRGAPDYGNVQVGSPIHRITDLGELAARLDSPVAYSRSGNVVWLTSFEYGLQGVVLTSDHEDSVGAISASRAFRGSFSLKLDPRDAEASYVRWSRVLGLLDPGKIGMEGSFSLDGSPDAIRLTMWYRDGETELYAPVVYETDGELWKIRDANLGWVTVLSGYGLQEGANAWHQIKLVIDTENKSYVWLLTGKQVIDLSDYSLLESASSDLGQLYFRVTVYGTSARHEPAYLDSVIITQNEE